MGRRLWVFIHRWAGLALAGFLVVVGLTGSLLAFYPELERLVNPHWYVDRPPSAWLVPGELAARLEAAEPRLRVNYLMLQDADETAKAWVEPRRDAATGKTPALGYEFVILDPATGAVLDKGSWGAISRGWRALMSFIYELHYSLALGMTGVWILGIAALVWTLDSFIGAYLTFPARRRPPDGGAPDRRKSWFARWEPAWKIRTRAGSYKLNFDLHRAGGLWLWIMLLIFAWSSVYMNLWDTVYTWTTRAVMDFRPPWVLIQPLEKPLETPRLDWREAQSRAQAAMQEQAQQHGYVVHLPVSLSLDRERGVYRYQVQSSLDIDDRPRRYGAQVYIDADTGAFRHILLPSGQYAGNTVSNWLYALHMGNVFGLPYRIFVSFMGLAIVMVSMTGVVIWWKKRKARVFIKHASAWHGHDG